MEKKIILCAFLLSFQLFFFFPFTVVQYFCVWILLRGSCHLHVIKSHRQFTFDCEHATPTRLSAGAGSQAGVNSRIRFLATTKLCIISLVCLCVWECDGVLMHPLQVIGTKCHISQTRMFVIRILSSRKLAGMKSQHNRELIITSPLDPFHNSVKKKKKSLFNIVFQSCLAPINPNTFNKYTWNGTSRVTTMFQFWFHLIELAQLCRCETQRLDHLFWIKNKHKNTQRWYTVYETL